MVTAEVSGGGGHGNGVSAEGLEARAVEATGGLDDFGDPTYRDGLVRLLASAANDAQLTDIGQMALEGQVLGSLVTRLRVTDWVNAHGDELGPVVRPLFIVGISRTGTTALSHLLGADPANRSLLGWEAADPIPPPEAATYDHDPRFLAALEAPNGLDLLNPGFKAIHHDPPESPMECLVLMAQHFVGLSFETTFNLASYGEWLLDTDHRPVYAWHRQMLQVLQSHNPGRWQLKSPHHTIALDALVDTYPDAQFVVTHRDPVVALASTCSLVRSLSGTFTQADFTEYIARRWSEVLFTMIDRSMAFRSQHGDAQFFDLPYDRLVRDPVGSVRAIAEHFGNELTPASEAAIRAHAEARPQNRFGRHEYSLADFGFHRGELDERFAAYRERFDVPLDPSV